MRPRLAVWTLLAACACAPQAQYRDWNGLAFEVPPAGRVSPSFVNADNRIYVPGREFVFEYVLTRNFGRQRVRVPERGDTKPQSWTYVSPSSADKLTVERIGLAVLEGFGGMDTLFPDHAQTAVSQRYYATDGTLLFDGVTGLVENSRNVWLHPFRAKAFYVAQLSPFPYARLPLRVGDSWTWQLDIDDRWSDPRVVAYTGKLEMKYRYEVTAREMLATRLGPMDCFAIDGVAESRLGVSRLRAYFNERVGFVRLDYINLDASRLVFDLVEVREPRAGRAPRS